jgi:serine/threonine protein kinase
VVIPLKAEDFTYTKVLGRGSFGKVMLAEKRGCDDVFAIKILKKTAVVEDDDVAGTMTEKRVLELSEGSPFLTKLHATFHTDAHLFFVMEFVNGGDLMYHIQNQRVFPYKQSQFYAAEIMLGLWYMHEKGVIYRDLKLDNVMLEASGHIKIADFGMCKENMFGAASTTTFCGTPGYLAPEIIREQPYGASVDFWSLGVLCYEFLVGDSPFEADEDDELFDQICNLAVEWPAKMEPPAKDFVDKLLDRNPTTRIGCGPNGKANIQKHAFFAGLDWVKMAARQIPPPFKPAVKNPKQAECFDSEFTDELAVITPLDKNFVAQIEQSEFKGFSFVNKTGALAKHADGDASAAPVVNKRDLRQYSWYRPQLNRSDVVRLLKGQAAGAFCVRESASQPGCFALSVSVSPKADKLWTGLITPTDDGKGGERYRLFVKQKFDNIPDLIEFYHSSPCVTIDQGRREVNLVDVPNL